MSKYSKTSRTRRRKVGFRLTYYYATYFGLLFAAYLGRSDMPNRQVLYWLLLVGLFVFAGFRFEVGCDWSGYANNFYATFDSFSSAFSRRNSGHWSVIHFLHENGLPYYALNVIAAAIFFIGFHALARRQPNPLTFLALAFPILIINMPMSAIRQGEAIGFICLAYLAFSDRRMILYIFWIILGSLFHESILFFMVLAPFIHGQLNQKNILLASLIAVPGLYALTQLDAAELAEERYIDSGVNAAGSAFRLGILSLTGLLFLWKIAPKWRDQFPRDYKLAVIGSWLMVGFFGLFFVSTVIGDRFGYYLIPIQLMIFTRIPYLVRLPNKKLLTALPYIGLTLVFVTWTQLSWHFNQCYIPYNNVLF